jgi:hypothetical protein
MSGTVTLILPCMPEMLQGKGAGEAVGGAVLHPTTGPHNVHHARKQNYCDQLRRTRSSDGCAPRIVGFASPSLVLEVWKLYWQVAFN